MHQHSPLDRRAHARAYLLESADVKRSTADNCIDSILAAARILSRVFRSGGKLLLCGNGGSAADCQHMATELVSRLTKDLERAALPAIALTTDTSFLTAFANDSGFDGVFERQVQAHGRPGDVLIGISTSGNSANVLRAVAAARGQGMHTIVLTGIGGGRVAALAETVIAVPSADTQHIQEAHLAIEHLLCYLVERDLFPQPDSSLAETVGDSDLTAPAIGTPRRPPSGSRREHGA